MTIFLRLLNNNKKNPCSNVQFLMSLVTMIAFVYSILKRNISVYQTFI